MNNNLINETNTKLLTIVDDINSIKADYEIKLSDNKIQIEQELAKVDEYKNAFNEAKKKIQKMSDDINGFEEDYRNLVDKFKDDELSNILTGVSKEINIKIKEKKRNIQRDQQKMNTLIDKAQDAKKALVKLTNEKKALETVLRQLTDIHKYYDEEFEKIIEFTNAHTDNLHPNEDVVEQESDESINPDDIKIEEKQEIVSDEDVNKEVVEVNEEVQDEQYEDTTPEQEEYEEDIQEEEPEEEVQEEYIYQDDDDEDNIVIEEENDIPQDDDIYVDNEEESNDTDEEIIIEDEQEDDDIPEDIIVDDEPEEISRDIDDIVLNDDLDSDDENEIEEYLSREDKNNE